MIAKCVEWTKGKRERFAIVIGAVTLFILYAINIPNICTVWEIEDETGYLFNAALFTGHPWKEIFSNSTTYYGYGYSLLLIPFFLLCDSSRELIQGAVLVNILLIVFTYLLQVKLISELFNKEKMIWIIAAFATAFFPYITGSSCYLVVCEAFLHFQLWLIAVLLYYTIRDRKKIYYALLSIATVFIFFIHARAIIIIAAVLLTIVAWEINTRNPIKDILIATLFGICLFGILFVVKNSVVSILGTGRLVFDGESAIDNLYSISYFSNRLRWLMSECGRYCIQAVGKIFYIITTTMGLAVWGVINAIRLIKDKSENLYCRKFTILFLLLSFVLMFAACAVNGTGTTYAYMFYGRYYEYTVIAMLLLGLELYFESKVSWGNIIATGFLTIITGIMSLRLESYAESSTITVDTNRIAGLSYVITQSGNQYRVMIVLLILLTVLFLIVCGVLKKFKYKNVMICIMAFIAFIQTNIENISTINWINERNETDIVMGEYICANIDEQQIYFVYEPFMYSTFYLRTQVFVKEYPIYIIYPEELDEVPEGSYVITYRNSASGDEMIESNVYELIMNSYYYELFVK